MLVTLLEIPRIGQREEVFKVVVLVDKAKKYRKITLLEAAKILPACIVGVQEEKKLLEN